MNKFWINAWFTQDALSKFVLQPVTLLALRCYVAWVFFASGLTKIQSWTTTLYLFEDEYQVPLLSPEVAAYLATAGELVLPILLVLGVGTRFAALGLFMLNAVAALSYPYLHTAEGAAGLGQHMLWGTMLWSVAVFGGGYFAFDAFWQHRVSHLANEKGSAWNT